GPATSHQPPVTSHQSPITDHRPPRAGAPYLTRTRTITPYLSGSRPLKARSPVTGHIPDSQGYGFESSVLKAVMRTHGPMSAKSRVTSIRSLRPVSTPYRPAAAMNFTRLSARSISSRVTLAPSTMSRNTGYQASAV